ncbi:hypothetical protein KUH03_17005 [Sphingobacterium sp. E70]|uniref:hypothetical protein n=1 Tax=Sphingobacterium sp. E70 TaxID=2853439 RepID=UPI00211C860C|nr:hypothetical protein [Sphingobacterium sp. E70]ULT28139.1 hypothetical protein KUH03_17005 [Sphingobacterium sp. E70]
MAPRLQQVGDWELLLKEKRKRWDGWTAWRKDIEGRYPPDTSIGDIGDYYFDIKAGNFYGPKKSVEYTVGEDNVKLSYLDWGMAISLRPTKPQNVKLYLMKPEFKNNVTLHGLELEAFSQKAFISEPWSSFLNFLPCETSWCFLSS